jgi:putative transposase
MRLSQDEKFEIINLAENSDLSANRTIMELGLHKRTYYNCYKWYIYEGIDGLAPKAKGRQQTWNKIPPEQQSEVIEESLEHEELSPGELAFHIIDHHKWFISESSI